IGRRAENPDRPQLMNSQSREILGVRRGRPNALVEEHPETGHRVQSLEPPRCLTGHGREVLIGPRPEPRLVLGAMGADRSHREPLVADGERAVRHVIGPAGGAGDPFLEAHLFVGEFVPASGEEGEELLIRHRAADWQPATDRACRGVVHPRLHLHHRTLLMRQSRRDYPPETAALTILLAARATSELDTPASLGCRALRHRLRSGQPTAYLCKIFACSGVVTKSARVAPEPAGSSTSF